MKLNYSFNNKLIDRLFGRNQTLAKVSLLLGVIYLLSYLVLYGIYDLGMAKRVEKVTIANEIIGLKENTSYKLPISIYPSNALDKKIIWQSNDESIAKISSDGTVKGIKSGTVIITASSRDKQASDSAIIVVSANDVKLEKITFKKGTIFLQNGYSYLIEQDFEPYGSNNLNLKYTSSNTDIVTVDESGLLTAKMIGKAIITVTDQNSNVSSTCNVIILNSGGELGNSN